MTPADLKRQSFSWVERRARMGAEQMRGPGCHRVDIRLYYAHSGDEAIARAVVEMFKGCISDVLVYKDSNRRMGITSALYKLIEGELGRR